MKQNLSWALGQRAIAGSGAIGGEVCDWRKGINANVSNKIIGVHWSPLEAIGGGDQKCILLLAIYYGSPLEAILS